MFVLMLFTRRGSEDGFVVRQYIAGESYDMADGLARYFMRSGWAVECCFFKHSDVLTEPVVQVSPFSFRF